MSRKLMCTLLAIFLVYSIIFVGTLIRNNLKKYDTIGRADAAERTLAVEAEGKVTVNPDIAITTMGMIAEGKTVAEAQQKNTDVMNKLLGKVTELGVDKKDVQTTNYNIYPLYDYTNGKQTIRGYQVSQSVTIKVRNLDKANAVLALAGEVGANNVSGLQFTIDDREKLREQARQLALKKVAEKRLALMQSLGVRLRTIVSYNEYEVNSGGVEMKGYGYGGSPANDAMGSTPAVESGSADVVMHVSVIFEVQQ
jgi:uncharacterized protein YggE